MQSRCPFGHVTVVRGTSDVTVMWRQNSTCVSLHKEHMFRPVQTQQPHNFYFRIRGHLRRFSIFVVGLYRAHFLYSSKVSMACIVTKFTGKFGVKPCCRKLFDKSQDIAAISFVGYYKIFPCKLHSILPIFVVQLPQQCTPPVLPSAASLQKYRLHGTRIVTKITY